MLCPFCQHDDSKVLDSRLSELAVRRRRECGKCERRFTTYERIEQSPFSVVKKDDRREQFDRQKLIRGVLRSCEKLPISVDQVETLVDSVECELRRTANPEVSSRKIGQIVMRKLKRIDKIAYIRFASVYREFTDVEQFEDEIKVLMK